MRFKILFICIAVFCTIVLIGCNTYDNLNLQDSNDGDAENIENGDPQPEIQSPADEPIDAPTDVPTDIPTNEPTDESSQAPSNDGEDQSSDDQESIPEPEPKPTVIAVTSANFESEVLSSDEIVLVDFGATWCPPCQMLAPILDEIAAENPQYKICKIDIDVSPDLANQYNIRSIPTIFIFKDGKIVNQHIGYTEKENILALFDV